MKLSKRTTTIILWAVSLGLLAGMVISFTPGLSHLGHNHSNRGPVQLTVNGQSVYEHDIHEARANPLFASVTEGEVGEDLQRLMIDQIVRQAVMQQAAARVNVSNGEVRSALNEFREERGVAGSRNDRAYQNLIASGGFTDQSFREYLREQLRISKFQERIVGDVEVTDEEVRTYYDSHTNAYQTEEQILARQIVVNDEALAQDLRRRALKGEPFGDLAREHSRDLAERDGALGAASGETEPRPVGRPALPTAVANAAFALRGAGVTDVVLSNERYFVVSVEEYLPPVPRPFEEVEDAVREDALAAKKAGLVEQELDRLRGEAQLNFPVGSELSFDNPVIAEVNGVEIRATDLDEALYTNPQIQQALSPQTADLIVGLFKPTVLSQVIDTEVAYQAAPTLGAPFVGTRAGIAQAAISYLGRDATASESELQEYYEENLDSFTAPAEAVVTRVDFATLEAANEFRSALLGGDSLDVAASARSGDVSEPELVKPGSLEVELDTALFETEAFEALPGGELEVSDVLVLSVEPSEDDAEEGAADEDANAAASSAAAEDAAGEESASAEANGSVEEEELQTHVVLVAERTPARVRPLDEVRAQVRAAVIAEKRQSERTAWLEERREEADVVEYMAVGDNPLEGGAEISGSPQFEVPDEVEEIQIEGEQDAGE